MALLLVLLGCVHRVTVTTVPAGAEITRGTRAVGHAPTELRVPPFGVARVTASLPGDRPLVARIHPRLWRARPEVELRLVPEHAPPG